MVVERFARNVNVRVLKLYVATGFFGTAIFFVLNAHMFTPLEIVLGIIFITILIKAISNIMLSMLVLLFKLDNKKTELDFEYQQDKIDELLSEISNKETLSKNEKVKEE